MSRNSDDRAALSRLGSEPADEQVSYYQRPFMVLWAAVQEASLEVGEDYGLSGDLAQLWVAERLRLVADSLVDRLAQKARAHGASKSNIARAAGSDPTNADRRFPGLDGRFAHGRMLIDDVLDTLD